MFSLSAGRRRRIQVAAGVTIAGLCLAGSPALVATATAGQSSPAAAPTGEEAEPGFFGGGGGVIGHFDARAGRVKPLLRQKKLVNKLDARVTWNRFGTPASLINDSGYLAKGIKGSDLQVAKKWLRRNAALFRLSRGDVAGLELVNNAAFAGNAGHAVTFRQKFGGLTSTQDGLIIIGVRSGKVAYVSSSAAGSQAAPDQSGLMEPTEAFVHAAKHIGLDTTLDDVGEVRADGEWTVFPVEGLVTPAVGKERIDQRARLVAFPTYTQGVKAAYEVDIIDDTEGEYPVGTVTFVDAKTGALLYNNDAVDTAAETSTGSASTINTSAFSASAPAMGPTAGPFTGTYTPTDCGPKHPIDIDSDTERIFVHAAALNSANDIVLKILRNGQDVGGAAPFGDSGTSPETNTYEGVSSDPPGTIYEAQVCPFDVASQVAPPYAYIGGYATSPSGGVPFPPQWKFFPANPVIPDGPIRDYDYPETDNRPVACWTIVPGPAGASCNLDMTPNTGDSNLASRVPWDHDVQANVPTFMTHGNNAITAEAWTAALTPGATSQRPIDFDRTYGFLETGDPQSATGPLEGWTNSWNENKCDYLIAQTPAQNNIDVMAATTTLFVGHNRFHDFSYNLGFTERNYNMQINNFGNTAPGPFPAGRENDPEIGNVQNGATLPVAAGLTRDNANQRTMQDGIPGITNQYLFQPIAGSFYAPCTDGDLDAAIYGHEYTHAISNRMVAGPDSGLASDQAGAMGESWSDQVAVEYLNAYGYVPTSKDENPFAVGIYATGNKQKAIRNYGMNDSPLNYSNVGYDMACNVATVNQPIFPECDPPEGQVHADGEIWSATGFEIRQAFVEKYNKDFPYNNRALQVRCADGNVDASKCPGNRRWIQIMFDAFLLQQTNTSMVDARDAYLAADRMRFGGANQKILWDAFAKRGLGQKASSAGVEDFNPVPSFESPTAKEATLKVRPLGLSQNGQERVHGQLFVGDYEARSMPIADSDPKTPLPGQVKMVAGTYEFVFRANGYGHFGFKQKLKRNKKHTEVLHLTKNMASKHNGAVIDGSSIGLHADSLIDDTEATNWAGCIRAGCPVPQQGEPQPTGSIDETNPWINVNLGGGEQLVRAIKVSAMLRPVPDTAEEDDDQAGQRFTALRQFAIETCTEDANTDCSGASTSYKRIYTSPKDAFDSSAPRPRAPDLLFKRFDVPDTRATHVRLVALENQCTGNPLFAGEQDNDPTNITDCKEGSNRDLSVRAAELQVFSFDAATRPPGDPVVLMLMKPDPLVTAAPGDKVRYQLTYTNLGPMPAENARITISQLPVGLKFVKANKRVVRDSGRLVWRLGKVGVDKTGKLRVVTRVADDAPLGTVLLTQAQFTAAHTFSPPAAAVTLVGPLSGP